MLNTGFDKSKNTLSLLRKIGFQRLTKDNGDENGFTIASLDAAAISAAINSTSADARLYPINYTAENTNMMLPEIIKETPMSGNVYKVMDKTRASETYFFQVDFEFAKILKSIEESGEQLGFYFFDTYDNFVGKKDAATELKLQPIPIANLFVDEFSFPSDSATNKIKVSFSIDVFPKELITVIPYATHKFGVASWKGLLDLSVSYVSYVNADKKLTVKILKLYSKTPVKGLLAADFTVTDINGVENVVVSSTESTTVFGQYEIVLTTALGTAEVDVLISITKTSLSPDASQITVNPA